jgi:hypothetical protein
MNGNTDSGKNKTSSVWNTNPDIHIDVLLNKILAFEEFKGGYLRASSATFSWELE